MRHILYYCLFLILLAGCKKEHGSNDDSSRIDIYLLKSFTATLDQTTTPATVSITNAVLDARPLVADEDIISYTKASTTFTLRNDIQPIILNYGSDKGFVVTVDNEPVYYGRFQSLLSSSIPLGVATIVPMLFNHNFLVIEFPTITGSSLLQQLDKRNDSRILNALKATSRLR